MMPATIARRLAVGALTVLIVALPGRAARAQSLTVLPIAVQMVPGQMTSILRIINQGDSETTIQIRTFAWSQPEGKDQLTTSDEVLASPPLAMIPPGDTQIVRLVLRRRPLGREATYRILLDQLPPPAAPGTVRIALRLSIPIFAQPQTRAVPHLQFHIESNARQASLVALNDGGSHEAIRDIALTASDGSGLKVETNASPYVLAGTTHSWRIVAQNLPVPGAIARLSARADSGAFEQAVPVVAAP
ncbi:fimbria/pilus periplasmic chaperone [Paraburkholderia sp. NMBU_R16]|uniref:fimbrial biogenesis chaperone n=1 Tax=Paraburkholderia sp. NMBU_R16 TaxID=2698676 RepID=UPI0015670EDF|nr:fimbria/pilus periplasmic chaperone [Paraburkholderia sp. NMBU_R16]NRO94632.1 fimbria/pilus periplasmic chaperone [Paraburkholderia sp. NMBU_R16]